MTTRVLHAPTAALLAALAFRACAAPFVNAAEPGVPPSEAYSAPQVPVPSWIHRTWTVEAHVISKVGIRETSAPSTRSTVVDMPEGTKWKCLVQPISLEPIVRPGLWARPGQAPRMWYVHRRLLCSSDEWRHHARIYFTVTLDAKTGRLVYGDDQYEMYLGGEDDIAVVVKNPWRRGS
jgi:hypothetical protein